MAAHFCAHGHVSPFHICKVQGGTGLALSYELLNSGTGHKGMANVKSPTPVLTG